MAEGSRDDWSVDPLVSGLWVRTSDEGEFIDPTRNLVRSIPPEFLGELEEAFSRHLRSGIDHECRDDYTALFK